jgi:hypothetical protein
MRKLVALALALVFGGCGDAGNSLSNISAADTACKPGQAQLAVQDGLLRIACGCTEAAAVYPAGTPLTCTVTAGTVVFFLYAGSRLKHQIGPTGTPDFPASPLFDPALSAPTYAHAVTFSVKGTYPFADLLAPMLGGQIVAR